MARKKNAGHKRIAARFFLGVFLSLLLRFFVTVHRINFQVIGHTSFRTGINVEKGRDAMPSLV